MAPLPNPTITQFANGDDANEATLNLPHAQLLANDIFLKTAGVFVAKIGGIDPDFAGSAIRTALSDFQNSGAEFGLFIVREDMDFSGGNLTVTKPFKMIAQIEPGGSQYAFAFGGTDILTLEPEATIDPGYVGTEFVGIDITRTTSGTGGIIFPKISEILLKFSRIFDLRTTSAVDFIRFTSGGIIQLEAGDLSPSTTQFLIGGIVTLICRRCLIQDTTGKAFSAAPVLRLLENTIYRSDTFEAGILTVFLDGTSILAGTTQVPTGFTTLRVVGNDFVSNLFGISLSDAINFNISGHLKLAPQVFSLGATILTITRSDLEITGTKVGAEGTRIETTPLLFNSDIIVLSGDRIRFQGIVFRSSPAAFHQIAIIRDTGTEEGIEIIDCEFQAEGSFGTGKAIFLGAGFANDRHLVRNCRVRSSPDGTPGVFRFGAAINVDGGGIVEDCTVENFQQGGIESLAGGTKISNCTVDMSSCVVSGGTRGIRAGGALVSNCRIICPTLGTNLDGEEAMSISDGGGVGSVVSNCQIDGNGTGSTKRIGTGIEIVSSQDSKVSGCTIRNCRKFGVKILGNRNVVANNIIIGINDGSDQPAVRIESGAIDNVVDTNIETATSGYSNLGGATNWIGTTNNTGNKSV